MQTHNTLFRTSTTLLAVLALTACGTDPQADRQIDEDDYVDQTEDGYDSQARVIGSTGQAAAVSSVDAYAVEDGVITEKGSAAMSEDGERWSLDVDVDAGTTLVFEAKDADGNRVGSTTVLSVSAEGETTRAAPMTAESDVEAQVFLSLQAERETEQGEDAASAESSVAAVVRLLVDAETAGSVEDSDDEERAMADLVAAIRLAVETEARSWEDRGEELDLDVLVDLFADLDADADEESESGGSLDIDLQALLSARTSDREDAGMDAGDRASVDSAISLGLIATLEGRDADADMQDAAGRIGAMLEASASVDVLSDFFDENDAMDEDDEQAILEAVLALRANVMASRTSDEARDAFADFHLLVFGELDIDDDGDDEGWFESVLDLDLSVILDLSDSLEIIADLRADLETRVDEEAESSEDDARGMAGFVLDAQLELEADIESAFEEANDRMDDAEADLAIVLITETQARYVSN